MSLNSIRHSVSLRMSHTRLRWLTTVHSLWKGPKIEKMLGYTNMDSEKGFLFFQKFMKEQGILKDLEAQGIEDGDTVRMYGFEFDYYK